MLVRSGFPEAAVQDMPLDKFEVYVRHARKHELNARKDYVTDTVSSIAGALGGKKGWLERYMDSLDAIVE